MDGRIPGADFDPGERCLPYSLDLVQPVDISNAILFLVSDDGRYVTGVTLPVDAGFTNKK